MIDIACWAAAVLLFFDGVHKLGKVGQHGIGEFEMIIAAVGLVVWLIAKLCARIQDHNEEDFN